jgi:hypothetical protein
LLCTPNLPCYLSHTFIRAYRRTTGPVALNAVVASDMLCFALQLYTTRIKAGVSLLLTTI